MFEEYKAKLQPLLKPERYVHSLGTADSARALAEHYGYDPNRAYLTGLLHDCAKNIPWEEQIDICEKNGVYIDDVEREAHGLLHAKTGTAVARTVFGIEDKEMLDAIAYHAIARVNMTLLDKIIYLADMIEPSRLFNDLAELRQEAFIDLDRALILEMNITLRFVLEKNAILHPQTVEARNDLLRHAKLDKRKKQ